MGRYEKVESLLKNYKYNKARQAFLENQLKRLTPELYDDFIESKMYRRGDYGIAPAFVMESGAEVAVLNKVEQTAYEYKDKCRDNYMDAKTETLNELNHLNYCISVAEDALDLLERVNPRYKIIIDRFYICNCRMEDIAESMHMSRSRCYELCKDAVKWIAKLVYGENAAG